MERTRSISVTALSGSAKVIMGAANNRPFRSNPQSSSNQELKAANAACRAGVSCLSASCMPTPRVGKRKADSRPWSSITASRAVGSRNSGCSEIGSRSPNMVARSKPSVLRPLK
ncbi:MAG: hypothetical protein Ct9H300mP12_03900 [Acidimicrobiales bacterium]|nr:MAG: hypothetical protein Ct9H300mP12_03900 [Acidimicrobiales bacterium]